MSWKQYLSADRLRVSGRKKDNDPRNEFESDFGRVIFSPATRRMHDKTQVFPLTADDNIHSRLTHSLEVMSIGHSLGLMIVENEEFIKKVGRDVNELVREIPVILKSACLVHDIGNPPFGHFGETIIQNYFSNYFDRQKEEDELFKSGKLAASQLKYQKFKLNKPQRGDFRYFDGNAQGFRVLTKLQFLNDIFGLNLTFATLGTYIKYPNSEKPTEDKVLHTKKRGIFQSEKEYLHKIAAGCGLLDGGAIRRHPLSYLMEAADSICYLIMDIEDGYNKDLYEYDQIVERLVPVPELKKLIDWVGEESEGDNHKMVNLRIGLIRHLNKLATDNFMLNFDSICNGTYNHELIEDDKNEVAEKLRKIAKDYIYVHKEIISLELTGHSIITGLLDFYINCIFHDKKDYRKRAIKLLSKSLIEVALREEGKDDFEDLSDYYKLRVIVDFISGMTDQYALNHFQKLSGQKIN